MRSYSENRFRDYFTREGFEVIKTDFDFDGNLQMFYAQVANNNTSETWFSFHFDSGELTYTVRGPFDRHPCRADDTDIPIYDEGSVAFKSYKDISVELQ